MDENQTNIQNFGEGIDIGELVRAIWKRKIMIISITLLAAILAGLYSVFIISPVYDTKLNIVISMPETYTMKYGIYKLPITTNQQYINLIKSNDVLVNTIRDMKYNSGEMTIEKLQKGISIGIVNSTANIVQNSFDVTVSADNAEESLKLAQSLYSNYIEFLEVMTKGRAITSFYNSITVGLESMEVSLNSDKKILLKNKELLANTPQTINQKEAMNAIQSQSTNIRDYVILENIINPNYTKIEGDIVAGEQLINNIEDLINVNKGYLAELDEEKTALADYYKTGKIKLDSHLMGVVESSVYLASPPVAPTDKTSPSNSANIIIGAALGGMIGVMIALVKKYWFKELPVADKAISPKL